MDEPAGYIYRPYPRRLYLDGDVDKPSLVVEDEFAEQVQRSRGYRKAHEPADEKTTLTIPTLAPDEKPKPGKKPKKAPKDPAAASTIAPTATPPEGDDDDGEEGEGDGEGGDGEETEP